jgi:mannosyltransferase OCH1-like enzyme
MQTVIGISNEKHKAMVKGKKKYKRPGTPFVFGNQLLDPASTITWGVQGTIPKLIHQTWKNDMLPTRWRQYFDKWSTYHPDFVHVLWTDSDNDALVKQCYPEFLKQYTWLPLIIQKTDFVRLMYLHQYGGIYADLDYECFDNVMPHLPQQNGVLLVESPLTFTEISQNSFMISEPGHPYIYSVLQLIAEIIDDMMDKDCKKYPFNKLYENVFVGKMLHTLSTFFLTGPATLDKALARAHLNSTSKVEQVRLLPYQTFYEGTVAKHHHNGSWFNGGDLLKMFFVVVAFTVIAIILTCVLTTFFSTKAVLKKKYIYE